MINSRAPSVARERPLPLRQTRFGTHSFLSKLSLQEEPEQAQQIAVTRRIYDSDLLTLSLPPKPLLHLMLLIAVRYFAIVFSAGFILGVVRAVLLVPFVGERAAELMEMPFMLAVVYIAARHLVRRDSSRINAGGWLLAGAIALVLLLAVEFGVVLALRGLSVSEYVAGRDPVSGSVYVVSLLLFAIMPWLHFRWRPRDMPRRGRADITYSGDQ